MKDTIFLTCNRSGIVSMRKNAPYLNRGEIAVKLTLTVPSAIFESYIPSVEVSIPESAVIRPSVEVMIEEPAEESPDE